MLSKVSRLITTTALTLGLSAAHAALVTQDFSVQWTEGLDANTTSQGSFSYADSVTPGSFTWDQLASFRFDFRGVTSGLSDVTAENRPFLESQMQSLLQGKDGGTLTFTFHQSERGDYYTVAAGLPSSDDLPYSSGNWQLASPVPEPGPTAMMLCGLVVMGAMAMRRRQAQG